MSYIQNYVHDSSVSQVRVLLLGPVSAGKSSFVNSVSSVFKGHITSLAESGSSSHFTSVTTQFCTYPLKAGQGKEPLPLILCDTMGLEHWDKERLHMADIVSILKGHVPDRCQFQPSSPMTSETPGFVRFPGLEDRIHCVVYVIDVHRCSNCAFHKLKAIRETVSREKLGVPQLVLLTKVDEACESVAEDIRNVYRSDVVRKLMKSVSDELDLPMSCIIPVKNYSQELELELHCDILLLSAAVQMLRVADSYLDNVSK